MCKKTLQHKRFYDLRLPLASAGVVGSSSWNARQLAVLVADSPPVERVLDAVAMD